MSHEKDEMFFTEEDFNDKAEWLAYRQHIQEVNQTKAQQEKENSQSTENSDDLTSSLSAKTTAI